jgi:general secretion pathway protein D
MTADGQTVVIGGLMETVKTDVVTKVPLLGDIPLLGWAFKRKQKEDVKKELLIFLTPHIVNTPTQLGALSRREAAALELAPKAFPKAKVEQFLEGMDVGERAEDETQP